MATARRRRSRDKPKSKSASRRDHPAGATSVHDVPDHLLELILLHLDSSACLLHAAASCKRWRRLVADANFLRRFRSLHAPRIAGHFHVVDPDWSPRSTDNPVFVPSSSLTVDSRSFSLDFLPDSDGGWALADSRGSLLLLSKRRPGWGARGRRRCLPDLVVCDPLSRRYQGILGQADTWCLGVFLLDGDHADTTGGGRVGMSSFRVVAVLHEHHTPAGPGGGGKPAACVFTPGSDGGGWDGGGWYVLPSASTTNSENIRLPRNAESISFVGRANGSLYWVTGEDDGGAMLALDTATMAFSRVVFTAADDIVAGSCNKWSFRVIGSDDGALRVVRLTRNELNVFVRLPGGNEWVVEKIVSLLEATRGLPGHEKYGCFLRNAMIVAAHERYVLVTPQEKEWVFSVDLETMEVEQEHERNKYPGAAYPYELPWPPALKACSDHGRKRR